MAYIGRYQQGDMVPLRVQCTNATGVPTMPDDVPAARLFTPSGALLTSPDSRFLLPPMDRYGTTGLFGTLLPTGAALAIAGQWRVVYTYSIGSYTGVSTDSFEVLTGGDSRGNVISAYYFYRPQADFIVFQTDGSVATLVGSGEIRAGRNPSI